QGRPEPDNRRAASAARPPLGNRLPARRAVGREAALVRERGMPLLAFIIVLLCLIGPANAQTDLLASWNEVATKKSITDFVARVTTRGPDFVPEAERIAVFDNDGTLWAEQPVYFQVAFAFDRMRAMAAKHPEWKSTPPYKTVLEGDRQAIVALGEKGVLQI